MFGLFFFNYANKKSESLHPLEKFKYFREDDERMGWVYLHCKVEKEPTIRSLGDFSRVE
jgi:hypothetical protein